MEVLPLSTNYSILLKAGKAVTQGLARPEVFHVETGGFSFWLSDKSSKLASEFGCFKKRLQLEKLDLIKCTSKIFKIADRRILVGRRIALSATLMVRLVCIARGLQGWLLLESPSSFSV